MRHRTTWLLACVLPAVAGGAAWATEYDLYPGQNIAAVLTAAQPGDILNLHAPRPGDPATHNRFRVENVNGAPNAWITVRTYPGDPRQRIFYGPTDKNMIELNSCTYLKIQNLELFGASDGVKMNGVCHHILLEDLWIDPGDTAINASGITELYNLTVRRVEILGTSGTGEGMYLGRHNVPYGGQVHDSLIEQCYIYNLGSTGGQGDGIELKHGCKRVIVQDNMIIANAYYPAITTYGTYTNNPADNLIVRRNFIWGTKDAGIHGRSEINVENNIVVGSLYDGIYFRQRDDVVLRHVRVTNNTVYMAAQHAFSLWNGNLGENIVIANNAFIQDTPAGLAMKAHSGLSAGVTVLNNMVYGTVVGFPSGYTVASSPADIFLNPTNTPGAMDFYPKAGGGLIDAADAAYAPADDFSLLTRPFGAGPDVGAYEVHNGAANPGWALALAFKDVDAAIIPGDVDRDADVDIFDVIDVIDAFGSVPGDPNWNENADFDHNGIVDVFDVIDTINDFGQTV